MASVDARRPNLLGARTWIGLVLGLVVLVLAARGTDLSQVWSVLKTVQPVFVLMSVAVTVMTLFAKAVRWRWLFYPLQLQTRIYQLSGILVIGQAVNFFIPGRCGELVRTYLG